MIVKKLNFGCGDDIKKGSTNVDMQKGEGIDISFDFNKFPYPLGKDKYDYIQIFNVLEHLLFPDKTLLELWKCSKKNAIIEISVPHYTNKGAYNSLQHRGFFNEKCFIDFARGDNEKNHIVKFELVEINILPTNIGKLLPRLIREKLALFVNGLLKEISVKYRIVK